jgi:hypothetical protein
VISLFSDAYTDVVVDTWLTPWSQGTYEEVVVAGNPVKKYTNLNFAGIETAGVNLLDVSGMTMCTSMSGARTPMTSRSSWWTGARTAPGAAATTPSMS